uniref:G_PROTEIN_RECEP_F1_2 domain-containing protein n=1 Tax=Mesocestoides corti TaxID=53468 RepID=A0A5K3FSJ2_MESCO
MVHFIVSYVQSKSLWVISMSICKNALCVLKLHSYRRQKLVFVVIIYSKSYACGNGLSRQAPSNQSAARLQNEHQTDLVDSGLGDSNNLRRASDFGSTHNRRSSELSLEHPDVSDQYRCIASPNAPSSKSSSMLSECNDPWTRQSPSKIKFTFADSDTKTRYQPIMTKGNETRKTDSSPTTQTTTALVCRRWCLPKKVTKKDSPPTSDTVHSSTDSDKPSPLDTANATFRKSLTTQNGLALLHERLFRFRNQSNVETRKIEQKKEKRARKALRMISFILGAFVVCWTPYHVVIIIKGFCDVPRLGYSCINEHLYNFAYYMCYMNSPINPFCYAMSNITFKRAFLRILKGDFRIR